MAIGRSGIKKEVEVEGQLRGAKPSKAMKAYKEGGESKPGLWANINRRKRLGISRPKSKSTISKKAYANMKAGFPDKKSEGGLAENNYEMRCVKDYTKNLI
jgi:hypothetical protein